MPGTAEPHAEARKAGVLIRPETDEVPMGRGGSIPPASATHTSRPRPVGPWNSDLRKLVRQHQGGAVEIEFRVPDPPAGLDQPELFRGPERFPVEPDRGVGVVYAEVGEYFLNSHAHTPSCVRSAERTACG